MPTFRLSFVIAAAAIAGDAPAPLRVIRVTPAENANPSSVITVTFDRPVAGSLDKSVDPRSVLTLQPALPGTWDWRDPVTVRFRPAGPLTAGQALNVTVQPGFTAMDGSILAEPYRWTFRVRGPEVLAGLPAGPGQSARFLPADARFQVVLSAPAAPAHLERLFYLDISRSCPTPGVIPLRAGPQTPLSTDAPYQFKEAGGWDRDRSADSLRRLVTLTPVRPLPYGCSGDLVAPSSVDAEQPGELQHWSIQTYGPFQVLRADCDGREFCPTGPLELTFTTPVRGGELLRRLTILPKLSFSIADTAEISERWSVSAELKPRTGYVVRLDSTLTDAFGQHLAGNPVKTFVTTSYRPSVSSVEGRTMVERIGRRTLGITYVNVDTLEVLTIPVPDSLEGRFLSRSWYAWGDDWNELAPRATRRRIAVGAPRDRVSLYGLELPAPSTDAARRTPTLFLLRVTSPRLRYVDSSGNAPIEPRQPIALVQVTDLAVHAKIGLEEGAVWVTGASDGLPRASATVVLRDATGRVLSTAVTDARGLARLRGIRRLPLRVTAGGRRDWEAENFDGYVEVRLGGDRALVGVNQWDPDLSPWHFNVSGAWGDERLPAAAAVFTERGIYRPGDSVFAKAILRTGLLGSLKVPARTDTVKLVFQDRDGGVLRESLLAPSPFGTLTQSIRLPAAAPLGYYRVSASIKRAGEWKELASAGYRVAEYRPPEFLVDVTADTAPRYSGDTLTATIAARYLFGAPMGRAKVTWSLRQTALEPWAIDIPNAEGFYVGAEGWWWEEFQSESRTAVTHTEVDTLDPTGHLTVRVPLALADSARAAEATLEAVVSDVNRQTVYAGASVRVHPAEFYLGAKPEGDDYFWKVGAPHSVRVIAVRPDGRRVNGVTASGVLIRREWHQVRREHEGWAELVGEWVSDTVGRCRVVTAADGADCRVTPTLPGSYTLELRARDGKGRQLVTSFFRWVIGPGWVPWSDESQFKMDVIPDKTRYSVGDTATVLFATPFTNAEAWITVEREGLIEQRRLRLTDGATTLKFPVTEAWAPNAYVSIVVSRGRSAPPGPLDDPGRPTLRVGYAELRVTPERKRLTVTLKPDQSEYRPGQRARIGIQLQDAAGKGARGEVTLWAVDEGVLSLTGFRTPDPIDLLYRERGLGLRLGSNLVSVAPQVPAGDKGRNPGGGGGAGESDVLRSRFKTTAFFLASVVTDSSGAASPTVTLPDNLTTFRLMAVAVTAGDRYGNGKSPLLVTRPLLARAALPRFLHAGDRFAAGAVINHRLGGTPTVRVTAQARGVRLTGDASRTVTLEAGRGRETRFDFTAVPADSATFRFDVAGARDSDAVQLKIPVLPPSHAGSVTASGILADTATIGFTLPGNLDLARSRITLSLGSSPVALLRSYAEYFAVYPYQCSEQVASSLAPLLALYRARRAAGAEAGDTLELRREIREGVDVLVRRQRSNGGIGLWSADDWTSPWLSVHAGTVLLEAREAGFPVSDSVVARLVEYVRGSVRREPILLASIALYESDVRVRLTERVALADFLSRARRPDPALQNELLRQASLLAPETRFRLATLLVRSGNIGPARSLLEPAWRSLRLEGRTVSIPDSLRSQFYFRSLVRPAALLLQATLAVDPENPLVAPLFETVVSRGRPLSGWWWNTQDYSAAVQAIGAWLEKFPPAGAPDVRVRVGTRELIVTGGGRDSSVALSGLVTQRGDSASLRVTLTNAKPARAYFALTVSEIPREVPVRPDYRGIIVERWYENYDTGKPVTEVTEGDLVRVRIRVTSEEDRAFVVVDDGLPAGLEAVDLSLRTVGGLPGLAAADSSATEEATGDGRVSRWSFGRWDGGWWSPFDHRELHDDRVVYAARALWKGAWTATYVARATTPGVFVRPPVHAEEMYNPAVYGLSDGGVFTVKARQR